MPLNALLIILTLPAFLAALFVFEFLDVHIIRADYFYVTPGIIVIAVYFILQTLFSVLNNNYYIPKLKKAASELPRIGIQIIGRKQ